MNVVGRVWEPNFPRGYSVATPFHPLVGLLMSLLFSSKMGHSEATPWYVRFGKFQGVLKDDQSSLEGSADLSEYGSSRYDNLDSELLGESQNLNPEVILVSVDGHVLTAPISASEQNAENVQLDTPRFNLGPAEETDFCEGNEELSSGENAWGC
ncbi:hypothetical protein M0R45_029305 [Rubus argutus]|uniref:Uncharacterized protein n=1 Tax=Rubus argutus TaxID=59490 RepID=A0AAW1WB97_RUBAR